LSLAEFLAGVFGRPGLVLHGQTAVAKRRDPVEGFQRDEGPPFFVLSLKAGATGLNRRHRHDRGRARIAA